MTIKLVESSLYFMSTFLCCATSTTTITILLAFDTTFVSEVPPDISSWQHLHPPAGSPTNSSSANSFISFCSHILSLILPLFTHNLLPHYIANSYHRSSPSLYTSLVFYFFNVNS